MEIVVVGAGVFGAWIALLSTRAGHRVTLVERFGPANDRSSSTGESRIIRSAYGSDRIYTLLARRSLYLWTEFLNQQNRPELFRQTGVLWMADAAEPSLRDARAIFEDLKIQHDWLGTSDILRRYPQFRVPAHAAALYEPEAGGLLAERCVQAAVDAATCAGASYETASIKPPATDVSRLRYIETTEDKHISGDLFIFAAGSWMPELFPVLQTVIRPTRQELFFFEAPQGSKDFYPAALPIWVDQSDPRIPYGFPDFGSGMKLGFHRLGPSFDPESSPRVVEKPLIAEAAAYLANRFPVMSNPARRPARVCHYENTPNGDFLIDRHPEIENVWLVGGGSGHGFKHAPAIAEYVLDSISNAKNREPRFSLASKQNAPQTRVL